MTAFSFIRQIMFLVRRVLNRVSTLDPKENADYWRKKGVQIGEGTYVYSNVVFGRGGRGPINVGKNCILTGCTIIGHDASTNRALGLIHGKRSMIKPVVIEDDCFIGQGAIVLMGVEVGRGSLV